MNDPNSNTKQNKFQPAVNEGEEIVKTLNTDEEDNIMFEVDEKVAYSTNYIQKNP